ncbi:MAG TPA: hypothetical protein ENN55_05145 [Firmicutes bacterium]|nr:hypothetical protein [Bacillota bacterium]
MEESAETEITIKELVILFAGIFIFFIVRGFFIGVPLNAVEISFAENASAAAAGRMLYSHIPDTSGPFNIYIYKIIFEIIGKSTEAIRIFSVLYAAVSALLLYVFIRSFKSFGVSFAAFFMYLAMSFNYNFCGISAGPEIFVHIPLLLALIFLTDMEKGYEKAGYIIAGVFMGMAALTTHIVWPALAVPLIVIIAGKYEAREKTLNIVWYLCGLIITGAAAAGWGVYNGNLEAFIRSYFLFNINEYITGAYAAGHAERIMKFAAVSVLFLPGFIVMARGIGKEDGQNRGFYLLFFGIFITAGILLAKNPRPDSFMAVSPLFACSAAFFADEIIKFFGNKKIGILSAVIFILAAAGMFFYGAETAELFGVMRCAPPGI